MPLWPSKALACREPCRLAWSVLQSCTYMQIAGWPSEMRGLRILSPASWSGWDLRSPNCLQQQRGSGSGDYKPFFVCLLAGSPVMVRHCCRPEFSSSTACCLFVLSLQIVSAKAVLGGCCGCVAATSQCLWCPWHPAAGGPLLKGSLDCSDCS